MCVLIKVVTVLLVPPRRGKERQQHHPHTKQKTPKNKKIKYPFCFFCLFTFHVILWSEGIFLPYSLFCFFPKLFHFNSVFSLFIFFLLLMHTYKYIYYFDLVELVDSISDEQSARNDFIFCFMCRKSLVTWFFPNQ